MDAVLAERVIARAAARMDDLVIDYEHQTLHTQENGQPAPAAGWFRPTEWRDDGLYATGVEWTDRARAMIEGGEYRYFSPVFTYDRQTGDVLEILMGAITNYAALDGLDELALRAAARFSLTQQEEFTVNEEQLKLLGLQKGASEQDIQKALAALKAKADAADQAEKRATDAEAAVAAAKAQTGEPDPAKYVPVAVVKELQNEIAALRGDVNGREVDELVNSALKDGKLLPAQESWARNLGKKDIAELKAYLKDAQPIAALKGSQTGGKGPGDGAQGGQLDDAALAVCRQMGIDPEQYKATLSAA